MRSAPPAPPPAKQGEPQEAPRPNIMDLLGEPPQRDAVEWGRLLFQATEPPRAASAPPPAPEALTPAPQAPEALAVASQDGPSGLPSAQAEPASSGLAAAPQPARPAQGGPSGLPSAQAEPASSGLAAPQPARSVPPSDEPAPARPARGAATPLGEPARRFLRPIVGVDPADVPVHRGAAASEIAARGGADAVAIGDEVFLGAGNEDESSPRTRALLAHELTHVARRREPRFVPPALRDAPAASADEEPLARAVESRARRAAERSLTAPAGPVPAAPAASPQAPAADAWNGLPAPWEPLPAWLNSSWAAPAPSPAPAAPPGPVADAAPVVARAAIDRVSDEPAAAAPAPAPTEPPEVQAPDIDALARQVYGVLKQRLAAERRRLG